MVMLRFCVALEEPDVALTVKVAVPALVGVPEITPVFPLRESPSGREPEVTAHAAPEVLDERVAEYDSPAVPEGRLVVVMAMFVVGVLAVLMVMLRLFVVLAFPDTALTVNVALPDAVGVPEITPDVLSDNPEGREPELIDHDAFERLAARVALYDLPTVPAGRELVVMFIVV